MKLRINAATLLVSAGLAAIGSLNVRESAEAASSLSELTIGRSTSSITEQSNWPQKPELHSYLTSSDKSLPAEELLDITNFEPIPGVLLLSPQLADDSHDLHQPLSSFQLPYTIDEAIGGPVESLVESLDEEVDGPLVSPEASGIAIEPADTDGNGLGDPLSLESISPTDVDSATEPDLTEDSTAEDNLDSATASSNSARTVPYILKSDDSLESLATRFSLSLHSIVDANKEESLAEMKEGDIIHLPWVPTVLGHEDFSTANHEAVRLARLEMSPAEDVMIWPTNGVITSGYGWRWGRIHAGIDIAGPEGTPVVAALSGRVIYSGWYYAYGYMVDIEHANGTVTRYAHASRLYVSVGEQVKQGQPIMAMGNTGRSTGPHLHFEVRQNGYAINPLTVLNGSSPSQNVATTYY